MGALFSLLESACHRNGAALMGVLNLTPDSFFDGGRYSASEAARRRVDELLADGADIIDIGGESTRPGSEPVPAAEQIARIESIVAYALERKAVVSIDTTKPEVAEHMLRLGAHIINDVSCLSDTALARVTAHHGAQLIIMHARGEMSQMAGFSVYPEAAYGDVVQDVLREWRKARERAVEAGLAESAIWLDPGIGFSKNAHHSYEILKRLTEFTNEGVPVVIGASRKSFIAAVDKAPPAERLGGTIAACLLAVEFGARVLRVHDVHAVRQALSVARAVRSGLEAIHA